MLHLITSRHLFSCFLRSFLELQSNISNNLKLSIALQFTVALCSRDFQWRCTFLSHSLILTTFNGYATRELTKVKKIRWHIPIHVDAASGGFIAPFIYPDIVWDFRLPLVKSINVSGHKYGLVYAGIGWVVWRNKEDLPEELVFHVNYLGADQPTFTLNFSKGASQVIAQYYQLIRLGFRGYKHHDQLRGERPNPNGSNREDRPLQNPEQGDRRARRGILAPGQHRPRRVRNLWWAAARTAGPCRRTPWRPTRRTWRCCAWWCARTSAAPWRTGSWRTSSACWRLWMPGRPSSFSPSRPPCSRRSKSSTRRARNPPPRWRPCAPSRLPCTPRTWTPSAAAAALLPALAPAFVRRNTKQRSSSSFHNSISFPEKHFHHFSTETFPSLKP